MNEDIVLDITTVIEKQKESKSKRFRISVLVIGVLVLAVLVIAAFHNTYNTIFLIAIGIVTILAAFTYSLPSRAENKFLTPYIADITSELNARGYKFADSKSKASFRPWFSSQSAFLYGDGLVINKSMDKGLKMRKIKFEHKTGKIALTVERIMTKKQIFIRVITMDKNPLAPILNPAEPLLKTLPPIHFVSKDGKEVTFEELNKNPKIEVKETTIDWDKNSLT